ncbi:MAG: P1 family peptidase [Candidatus Limnocylindrales bacterium]
MAESGTGAARLTIRDVRGVRVGHATDPVGLTGCTVVLAPPGGAVAGVDVRGSAPGTRETDALRPTALVERIQAICLCGGSAFGLAAADGVMGWLAERGLGFPTNERPVPVVPTAVIYDLALGSAEAYPDAAMGRAACEAAELGDGPLEGSVGAGTGATVGKVAGPERAMKSGVGSAAVRLPDGTIVGALAVTNALGDVVVGRDGRILAGARDGQGGFLDATRALLAGRPGEAGPAGGPSAANTTLAVIATDARLDRAGCRKLAELGHDALALAIRPVHTLFDGDTVFTLSVGDRTVDPLVLGVAAVEALRAAIERSVLTAAGLGGLPGLADAAA